MRARTNIPGLPGYGSFMVTSSGAGTYSPPTVFIYSQGDGPSAVAFHMTASEAREMAAALLASASDVDFMSRSK